MNGTGIYSSFCFLLGQFKGIVAQSVLIGKFLLLIDGIKSICNRFLDKPLCGLYSIYTKSISKYFSRKTLLKNLSLKPFAKILSGCLHFRFSYDSFYILNSGV